jgi:RNA polymerase sigma factor (sigma-70 family)
MVLSSVEGDYITGLLPEWDNPCAVDSGMDEFEFDLYSDGDQASQLEEQQEDYDLVLSDFDVIEAFIRGSRVRTGLLSEQQEVDLAQDIQQGIQAKQQLLKNEGNADLELLVRDGLRAEELLVAGNALFVASRARIVMNKRGVLVGNLDELFAQGLFGLAEAARKYNNPSRARFAAFARPIIDKYIRSSDPSVFGSAVHFSREVRESVVPSLFATRANLASILNRQPTMEELSVAFNEYHEAKRSELETKMPPYLIMTPEKAFDIIRVTNPDSLSMPIRKSRRPSGNETTLDQITPDISEIAQPEAAVVTHMYREEVRGPLIAAIIKLSDQQRRVLLLTFQFGIDPDEGKVLKKNGEVAHSLIAKVVGILPQHVSPIRKKALAQLAGDKKLRQIWAEF